MTVEKRDFDAMCEQLGREVRGVVEVAHRCNCGNPDVVKTLPRLENGTPFPTTYYVTCPRLTSRIGTLEANGVMKDLEEKLNGDIDLQKQYLSAHNSYLADRAELGDVEEIADISAGGMPTRVKCLHVLIGHSLAKGPGVNPIGDMALGMLEEWGDSTCVTGEETK
ncbi:MAG: hypothetical protein RLZZ330_503 [Actinomycetota bacterium]|jgi:hypothetical protein